MPRYQIRDADTYGHAIGILLLDYRGPFIPGDVGNASTYGYPVLYKLVPGLTLERVLAGDREIEGAIVEAAKDLERFGVRAISSDCGFLIQYQAAVQAAVSIPVLMSSLLQIPFLAMSHRPRPVGLITATAERLSPDWLALAGITDDVPLIIRGMDHAPHFRESILEECGWLDSERIEAETVEMVTSLVAEHPDVGSIVLECSLLPPYAHAVQAATGRPTYDFVTMIDFLHAGTHRRPYVGNY